MKTRHIGVCLSPESFRQLKMACALSDRSISQFASLAIEQYIRLSYPEVMEKDAKLILTTKEAA